MATCKVCQHPKRKEIERDMRSGMKNVGRKWKIDAPHISKHKYNRMNWNLLLTITKTEFCEICLEREGCKKNQNLKICEYWREYCEDMGRSA